MRYSLYTGRDERAGTVLWRFINFLWIKKMFDNGLQLRQEYLQRRILTFNYVKISTQSIIEHVKL